MKCFYHSADLDCHASGAIVKHKYPGCEMIGINYCDPFPWDSIRSDETIYFVDFCLQPFVDMLKLADMCDTLVLIDHHKTTDEELQKMEDKPSNFKFYFALDKAGCELTWEYIYPKIPMPKVVRLLGRYDIWDQSNTDTLPFQYGLRMYPFTTPGLTDNMDFWKKLFANDQLCCEMTERIISEGNLILKYVNSDNAKYATQTAFEMKIRYNYEHRVLFELPHTLDITGYITMNAIVINRALGNSMVFDSVYDPATHDLMVPFYLNKNGTWTVSLYTTHDHIDCSKIAKVMGGGGHKQAAGFQIDDINKILKENK